MASPESIARARALLGLDDEEKRRIRAQQADVDQYREVKGQVRRVREVRTRTEALKELKKLRARPDLSTPLQQEAAGGEAPTPEQAAGLEREIELGGGLNPDRQLVPRFGSNLEAAMASIAQYDEETKKPRRYGDQMAVFDPVNGSPLAIRDEAPPVLEHLKAGFKTDPNATVLGSAGSALDSFMRGLSTIGLHAQEAARGKDTGGVSRALGDAWDAAKGGYTPRSVTSGGGLATTRAEGLGDVLRLYHAEAVKKNPSMTYGEWRDKEAPAFANAILTVYPYLLNVDTPSDDTPLAEIDLRTLDMMGLAAGIAGDPVPYDKIVGGPMKVAAKGAAKVARPALDAAAKLTGAPVRADDFARAALKGGELGQEAAETFGKQAGAVEGQALAKTGAESARYSDEAAQVFRQITPEEAQRLLPEVESIRHLDEPAALLAMRESGALEDIAKLAPEPAQRVLARSLAQADDSVLDVLRRTADDLPAEEAAQLMAEQARVLDEFAPLLDARYTLAHRVGRPTMFMPDLPAGAAGFDAAKGTVSSILNRAREAAEQSGLFRYRGALNYVPHIDEAAGSYRPLARRTMVPSAELADIRSRIAMLDDAPEHLRRVFAGKNAREMLDALPAAREFLGLAKREDTIDIAELALQARKGSKDAKLLRDPAQALGQYLEAIQPSIGRARFGKALSEIDYGGRPLARGTRDYVLDAAQRVRQLGDDALAAKGIDAPAARAAAERVLADPLSDVFEPKVTATAAMGSRLTDEANILASAGGKVAVPDSLGAKIPALRGKWVPPEVIAELERMGGRLTVGAFEQAMGVIGRFNKYWIPLMLSTPGFHIRNGIYGFFQMYLAVGIDGMRNPLLWRRASQLARLAEKGAFQAGDLNLPGKIPFVGGQKVPLRQLVDEMIDNGIIETGLTAELGRLLPQQAPYKGQWAKQIVSGLNPASKRFLPARASMGVNRALSAGMGLTPMSGGATIENLQRAYVYLFRRARGDDVLTAAAHTKKFLFDYTGAELSALEKSIRKVVPFYQWIKYSTKQAFEMMLFQPGKFQRLNRIFNLIDRAQTRQDGQDPTLVPQYVRDRGGVGMPDSIAAGLRSLAEKFDLPYDPSMTKALMLERPGTQMNILKDPGAAMTQLGPVASTFLETVGTNLPFGTKGRYLFGGGEISPGGATDPFGDQNWFEDLVNLNQEDIPYYLAGKAGPWAGLVREMVSSGPSSARFDDVQSDEKLMQQLISMILGVRYVSYDPMAVAEQQTYKQTGRLRDAERALRVKPKPPSPLERWLSKE